MCGDVRILRGAKHFLGRAAADKPAQQVAEGRLTGGIAVQTGQGVVQRDAGGALYGQKLGVAQDHGGGRAGCQRGGAGACDAQRGQGSHGVGMRGGDDDARGKTQPGSLTRGQIAADRADIDELAAHLGADHAGQARIGITQQRRIAHALAVLRLVRCQRARQVLIAGKPLGQPVADLQKAVGRVKHIGRLAQHLPHLGKKRLGGQPAAHAGKQLRVMLAHQLGQPRGLPLRGMVLPQLDIGVRIALEPGIKAQRRAGLINRQGRATGKIHAHADDIRAVDIRLRQHAVHGGMQGVQKILRVLQGIIGGQGRAAGQTIGHYAVGIGTFGFR